METSRGKESDLLSIINSIYSECGAYMNNLENQTKLKISAKSIADFAKTEGLTEDEAFSLAFRILNMINESFVGASMRVQNFNVSVSLHEFATKCLTEHPDILEKIQGYLPSNKGDSGLDQHARKFLNEVLLDQVA